MHQFTRKTVRKAAGALLLLVLVMVFSGCAQISMVIDRLKPTDPVPAEVVYYDTVEFYSFGNLMTVTCYGDLCSEACMAVREEFFRLDGVFSAEEQDAVLTVLNTDGEAVLDEDTAAAFNAAIRLYWSTEGAFDITLRPVRQVWGFDTGEYRVADALEVKEAAALVGSNRVAFDLVSRTAQLDPGQSVDLSGLAFGTVCDRLPALLAPYGVQSAMIISGQKVYAYGSKPDGEDWRVGISVGEQAAATESDYLGVLSVSDRAVFTADPYEEYFIDGTTGDMIHHLLDPKTGYPAESGLGSVTVVASSGSMAEGLASALFVMGQEKAVAYWQANRSLFDMVLVTDEGQVFVTGPLASRFETESAVTVIN